MTETPNQDQQPETPTPPASLSAPSEPVEPLTSVHTTNFPDILRQLNVSLIVTTYQAGKVVFVRPEESHLNTHFRTFDRPMGLAYHNGHLALGCGAQIWEFYNVPAVGQKVEPVGTHDACFVPRRSHVTGDIDIHEMVFDANETLWFVNTRFSCLCHVELTSSFAPVWRPPFVSALAPEDRCHLNGLALVDGQPKYLTCLGKTDEAGGWRANKANGGLLLDMQTNEILLEGLSMPHSPRWYQGKLWLLESGDGSIGWVDLEGRKYHKICELPGFTRGIDFVGPLAFVGLSQVRETAIFSGIPITQRLTERISGVYVVNIETGELVAFLKFTGGVQELFAVQVLPGILRPELLNEFTDLLKHAYVLPEQVMAEVSHSTSTDTTS
ncbi:MAG: TIGR03032 family protein [Gemmataceae bacterium]